ncbi:DnaJ domain-containing protein [Streptosporangium sp. NPDC002721]|uniref:DnaJ domain-containing protein n=1 Tax=Streptosporangium sp. NPDC002721 TaxID=3366188 RepID=UPI0036B03A60
MTDRRFDGLAAHNAYDVLNLPHDADARDIRASYLRLAQATHPDKTGTKDSRAFNLARRAYEILSDADTRAAYDAFLTERLTGPPVTEHHPHTPEASPDEAGASDGEWTRAQPGFGPSGDRTGPGRSHGYDEPAHETPRWEEHPGFGQPEQPEQYRRPDQYWEPEHPRTGYSQPGYGRPDYGRPEYDRPGYGRPEHGRRPWTDRPGPWPAPPAPIPDLGALPFVLGVIGMLGCSPLGMTAIVFGVLAHVEKGRGNYREAEAMQHRGTVCGWWALALTVVIVTVATLALTRGSS